MATHTADTVAPSTTAPLPDEIIDVGATCARMEELKRALIRCLHRLRAQAARDPNAWLLACRCYRTYIVQTRVMMEDMQAMLVEQRRMLVMVDGLERQAATMERLFHAWEVSGGSIATSQTPSYAEI